MQSGLVLFVGLSSIELGEVMFLVGWFVVYQEKSVYSGNWDFVRKYGDFGVLGQDGEVEILILGL